MMSDHLEQSLLQLEKRQVTYIQCILSMYVCITACIITAAGAVQAAVKTPQQLSGKA